MMTSSHTRRRAGRPAIRPGYWFLPKAYGYGVYPATISGWVATAVYLLAVGGAIAGLSDDGGRIVAVTCLTIGWLTLLAAKTDGTWRWRWGDGA